MKKKNCTNCDYANFDRTEGGRRNLNSGECLFVSVLPNSYQDYRGTMPGKKSISKYTKSDCYCWSAKITGKNYY